MEKSIYLDNGSGHYTAGEEIKDLIEKNSDSEVFLVIMKNLKEPRYDLEHQEWDHNRRYWHRVISGSQKP